MKAILFTTALFLLFQSLVAYADVSSVEATIDKNPVMLDEAIRLTVVANGGADRDAFDSSALLKDFVVGRTSVSSQTSIVNFDTKKTTTWTTTLFPRKEGTFTMPSFTIEGKQTTPIRVKVIPVQQSDNATRDYYVTTSIDIDEAYLNQQLFYTVKLHLATNIERGSLQSPEMENAEIKQLGDDKQYTEIINGKRYQIIERQFAIVPQSSGEFTIHGPIFSAEVMAPNNNQRFGFFNRTQQINRVGPDITVNIKPIPPGINYPWLPSEMVRIDEEWPQGQNFTVGEPITRVITLTALGVVEEQLPDIPEFYPPGFKLYPDQSNTTTVERDNALIAQRKTSLAVIPTKAGDFVLPEITVPWFNTLTEKTEYATIPPRTVTVQPAATSNTSSQPESTVPSNEVLENDADTQVTAPLQPTETDNTSSIYSWLFGVLWIVTLAGWFATYLVLRKRSRVTSIEQASHSSVYSVNNDSKSEQQAYKKLLKMVKQKEMYNIAPALQHWMQCLYPDSRGFINPADHDETSVIQAPLNTLQKARFSNDNDSKWQPDAMLDAIKQARDMWIKKSQSRGVTLSNLYPSEK